MIFILRPGAWYIGSMPNHLVNETSPYLLQHIDNPVDWYPWGEPALALAKSEHKPILLSIGYAACHWCHVMAHESFEDEASAGLMNRWFINIKVDREERPDLDSIYMSAVTRMTGQGGWPMTVFLTPQGKPFFSGTYFPPEPRHGLPSFTQVLSGIADAWQNRQDEVQRSADEVTQGIQGGLAGSRKLALSTDVLTAARVELSRSFDTQCGGFGSAPKFPQPMVLEYLLREHLRNNDETALEMLNLTLVKMAQGGMYDQLGGGFARYSTDQSWLVPHFEKMLYDNAQLVRIYLRTYQVTGNAYFRHIAEQTLDYVLREMRHADGGFYSSQDADSEGVEGKFFVWKPDEIRHHLGDEAELFMRVYDVTESGNWEGNNILHLTNPVSSVAAELGLSEEQARESLQASSEKLYLLRSQRIWPGLDDKVLTSWNGLMMSAFAEAGRVLGRTDYIDAARSNAIFLQHAMRGKEGRLMRTWKAGSSARYNAYLEDYACLAEGLLTLYEASFDSRWFEWAEELALLMLQHFTNSEQTGFYDTSDDHERLIHRPQDVQDNAMPSGNAKAAMVLFRIGLYNGNTQYMQMAEESVAATVDMMKRYPAGFGEWLNVASFILGEAQELALVGPLEDLHAMRAVLNKNYHPNLVVAAGNEKVKRPEILADRPVIDEKPTAYLCRRFSCQKPVTDASELRDLLNSPVT